MQWFLGFRLSVFLLSLSLSLSSSFCFASEDDFVHKSPNDFPLLHEFSSVSEFEQQVEDYESACLKEFAGSTSGLQCFVAFSLWQREVDFYLSALNSQLTAEPQDQLKINQGVWRQYLQNTRELNFKMLTKKYPKPGTLYVYLRSKDAHEALTPIVRARALLLRQWHTGLRENTGIRPGP